MNTEYKKSLAVIGAGNWGRNLVRNFFALGCLHTICDANESLLNDYKNSYPEIRTTNCADNVFVSEEIQQIVIAAPAAAHFVLAKQALENGKDVFVEKPLCLNQGEANELIELADKFKCTLMVGHLLHYHPIFNKLEQMIQEGEIGELKHISCHRLKLGRFRTEENVLWSFAPHDFSVILSLCGNSLPRTIRCNGHSFVSQGIEDITMTNMAFPDGKTAHIYTSWVNPFKEQKLVAVGTEGFLTFDDTKPWNEKLSIVRKPITYNSEGIPQVGNQEPAFILVEEKEPLREECLEFLRCCMEKRTPKTCGREGLMTLQALQAAEKSLQSNGKKIQIPSQAFFAHESAVIDEGAIIGKGSNIWHFCHILPGAVIGEQCNLGQNVTVFSNARLGNKCKVQNNVSVYSGVICEDNVFLGPSMVFTNILNPRSEVSRKGEYISTYICKGASIGANATVLCGITIGKYSFVGAGAVVTKNTKPYSVVAGNPARQIGWMSRHGEKLDLPLESVDPITSVCSSSGEIYQLQGDKLDIVSSTRVKTEEHVYEN